MQVGRGKLIAALDLGTTKACCFIARIEGGGDTPRIRVAGIGHQVSEGMKAGAVVNMEAVEGTIRAAVGAAERMAGETIQEAYLNISGGAPSSHTVGVEVAIAGQAVGESDLRQVLEHGRSRVEPGEREVIHAVPVGYTIDGAGAIQDPLGMYGERLGVNIHVVTAAAGPLRNLGVCAERGHLGISALVVSPYASGLACLVEDELDLGATCIDMGGGTTSIAIFCGGRIAYTDVIPVGGMHVTNDIARGLSTPVIHAERLKTLHGSAIASASDDHEILEVPQIGDASGDNTNHVPRSVLTGVVRPRLEETFELVRDSLMHSGFEKVIGRRVVLTGGASQLQGVEELAARMLNKQVRPGRPIRIAGLAEATEGPAFSTCAGLLAYAARAPHEALEVRQETESGPGFGRVARIGKWLKENF